MPIVNSSLDEEAGEIVLHDHYHIGIAVATPSGLIVPVVRNADKKDLFEVAAEVERLGTEGKAGRARREDLRGGTFTVTSTGGIGGLISTPIINYPEVGIMGIGKVVRRPVYDNEGHLNPADLVYLVVLVRSSRRGRRHRRRLRQRRQATPRKPGRHVDAAEGFEMGRTSPIHT